MILELIFNFALLIFFIYSFIDVGNIISEPTPGMLDAAEWPRILLGILIIFTIINIISIFRKKENADKIGININLSKIIKSKLFIGILFLLIYAFLLDITGFIVTSLVFFILYSRLLGEKNIKKLLISSILCIVILYIIFDSLLGIMLPRGIGIFRNFALFLESLI